MGRSALGFLTGGSILSSTVSGRRDALDWQGVGCALFSLTDAPPFSDGNALDLAFSDCDALDLPLLISDALTAWTLFRSNGLGFAAPHVLTLGIAGARGQLLQRSFAQVIA